MLQDINVIGQFQDKDSGKWFSYTETENNWALAYGLVHEIIYGNNDIRVGCVRANRAKIAIAVNEDDIPVLQTLQIQKHHLFQQFETA